MKKTKLILSIIFLLSLLISQKTYSQDTLKIAPKNYHFGIGFGGGFTTGSGISFKYTPSKFGMLLNFAPYKNESRETYSVGLTFIYKILEDKNVNLFLYQGNHYHYESWDDYSYFDPNFTMPAFPYRYYNEGINNGLGFGFEFIFAKRMSFNLMTGFATYDNFSRLDLTFETGLYYNFK